MMKQETFDWYLFAGIACVVCIALITIQNYRCGAQWVDSGLQSRYTIMGGCRVQLKNGTWIREDRYREIGP